MIVETQVLRPPKIFSWIALPFMLLYTYIIITDDILTTKNIIVCIIGWLLVAGTFAINRSSIVLDNEGIMYKRFRGQKFIAYRDIVFADLVTHYHGHGYGCNVAYPNIRRKRTPTHSPWEKKYEKNGGSFDN